MLYWEALTFNRIEAGVVAGIRRGTVEPAQRCCDRPHGRMGAAWLVKPGADA